MNLAETIYLMNQRSQLAAQPTDLKIGTVTSTDPLEITLSTNMAPLQSGILLLTSAVVERKIPVLEHNHTVPGSGTTSDALSSVACYENGTALPVENGYIILNRALAVGDKVIMLRVQRGQKFIVLSRVY